MTLSDFLNSKEILYIRFTDEFLDKQEANFLWKLKDFICDWNSGKPEELCAGIVRNVFSEEKYNPRLFSMNERVYVGSIYTIYNNFTYREFSKEIDYDDVDFSILKLLDKDKKDTI